MIIYVYYILVFNFIKLLRRYRHELIFSTNCYTVLLFYIYLLKKMSIIPLYPI